MFSIENIMTLAMLILLQAVLGFDNLLYISIESKRAPLEKQALVRKMGIGIAIALRIILLFVIVNAIQYFQDPICNIHIEGLLEAEFNLHSITVLLGGGFIIFTATKEILHILSLDDLGSGENGSASSVFKVVSWIVVMNLVFSFDSILSAIALTDQFYIMAIAIVVSGILMIWLAERVSEFLNKNRMYEVLGLFILFVVGIMLLSEGGHLGHLMLFGHPVEPMTKTTFYFVIAVLVIIDLVQTRYQKKIAAIRKSKFFSEHL